MHMNKVYETGSGPLQREPSVYFKAAYKMLSILQYELFIEECTFNLKVTILLKDLRNYEGNQECINVCNIWVIL